MSNKSRLTAEQWVLTLSMVRYGIASSDIHANVPYIRERYSARGFRRALENRARCGIYDLRREHYGKSAA